MKISGSIYSDNKRPLKETIADLEAHQVDLLHVDCNDDIRVFDDIADIRTWCKLPIDLHIITKTPEKYFDLLRKHPVEYVTFQYEELPVDFKMPADIKGQKGLAIITPTDISAFDKFSDFDFILIMATIPGQSGGVFDPINFKKIRNFKQKYPNKNVHVDGGVNGEVSFILRNMGVHTSVSGSFLFKAASVGQALMDLTKREIVSLFKIKDFMIPREECPIIDISELTLKNVLEQITFGKLGVTLVEKNKKFEGIISNADLRRTLLQNLDNIEGMNTQEMINKTPVTILDTATVDDMLNLVREQSFPVMYLPVLNAEGNAVGIITFVNLIKGEI
ncbi:MAG: CBS domain-containing protein [Flavobacteriales bacterium]|nr:CBS domain-containing protein [Flavobacteriales bacterium]MCW8912747.1 CBS domain-containing protein [Flavobacteriales bacterium]MCW8936858.1 CBS domain-containing protein [Flavobacteriales bacterium]MCW8940806.1 CBS domain-containing protein [Flavobacteriales bacterium]MCW8968085.1 CBS domain-containing protein [Flavobacteriales bacterium]